MFNNLTSPVMTQRKESELTSQLKRNYYTKINILLLHFNSGCKYEVVFVY